MQNESPATGPDDSTADLGAGLGNSINLTEEQATNAGITDPQVGDSYQITIKVGDNSDGVTATILDGSAAKLDTSAEDDTGGDDADDAEAGDATDDQKPADMAVQAATPKKKKSNVMSPKDMGISMTQGL